MTNHGFRLVNLWDGEYEVFDRGEKVGMVRRRERYYNLRRPFTMRWWDLINTGKKVGEFDTRSNALDYLRKSLDTPTAPR